MAYLYIYSKASMPELNVYRILSMDKFDSESDIVQITYATVKQHHKFASTQYTIAYDREGYIYDRNGTPIVWYEERRDEDAANQMRRWRLDQLERREAYLNRLLNNYKEEKERLWGDPRDWIKNRIVKESGDGNRS